jgi:hypothetical protein
VLCALASGAFAGDYTVSYALDAGDLNDSGMTDACMYALPCVFNSDKLDLSINLSVLLPRRGTQKRSVSPLTADAAEETAVSSMLAMSVSTSTFETRI